LGHSVDPLRGSSQVPFGTSSIGAPQWRQRDWTGIGQSFGSWRPAAEQVPELPTLDTHRQADQTISTWQCRQ
jgi:hypothetical protein